jgi:hypothetical protein
MKKSELRALIRETIKEIALNKSEYEVAVEDAANRILDYAMKHNKYPDINTELQAIVRRFGKDIDDVHTDVARAFHEMR